MRFMFWKKSFINDMQLCFDFSPPFIDFVNATEQGRAVGDSKNNCSLKALTIALQRPYGEIRREMVAAGFWSEAGHYNKAHSMYGSGCLYSKGMLVHYGIAEKEINCQKPAGGCYTPISIGRAFPTGTYICIVRGHTFALVDGVVQDWTNGRRHKIKQMFKIN